MNTRPAPQVTIHATCVAIGRQAILLLGASGAGKSDLALRLIDEGARLIADDRTILTVKNGRLNAHAPVTIRGLLEIRGLGIVKLPAKSLAATLPVALVVQLGVQSARLPHRTTWQPPAPLNPARFPPQMTLDRAMASGPARIRAALAAYRTKGFRDTFNQPEKTRKTVRRI